MTDDSEPGHLVIRDGPGLVTQKFMRGFFEGAVRNTPALAKRCRLDCEVEADGTVQYVDPATHAVWCGFALGMRCAERIEQATRERATLGISSS